ncbi:hypothetical protein MIND_00546500 [Mycena indigotica]|uniref:FAD/NAD(P)-binding domain-containing protein n=1 Tax=Mycena indigotica TaxID=2126181 RepID=A0A8H6SY63_9AGAR|nr:uncharacterized protein MIND_00546500 [Mycena indigotica]KAF7307519.1 hypothetical protein MIND_00546500 [Mycena indigotica]
MTAITNIDQLPGSFPDPSSLSVFTDDEAVSIARTVAPQIVALLTSPEKDDFAQLFLAGAFWRDLVALSWTLRTFHPTSAITESVVPLIKRASIDCSSIRLDEAHVVAIPFPNGVSVVRAPFTFTTSSPSTQCTAAFKIVRLSTGHLKVLTVTTALHEVNSIPWRKFDLPAAFSPTVPTTLDVLVVGGGHAGLSIAAYLKALGVDFVVVEKQNAIGDSWSKRYDSTTLHTTRVFSGLPFVGFPSDYPQYIPAKLIANYYTDYVNKLHLPVYCGRECVSATWDASSDRWEVTLNDISGNQTIRVRTLVFATGIGGRFPLVPDLPGKDAFKGQVLHSIDYTSASRWAGKRVAIVGASTTACDVALDCVKAGVEVVTMIQRGATRIYPQEHITRVQARFWNDDIPVEVGDSMATEDPMVLSAALSSIVLKQLQNSYSPEFYAGLKNAGFIAAVDGSVHQQIYCRAGAHYPDIGACGAISRGEIQVKSDANIDRILPTAIAFSDNTRLDTDVIVYCTGFEKDARNTAAAIIGKDTANILEPVWGLDAEGEVRGCWRPSGHHRIWFHGGELQTMRYYGRFLAMQIAAEIAGVRPSPARAVNP